MTKAEIAKLAMLALTDASRFHVDPMNIMRELNIDSAGAAEIYRALGKDFLAAETGSVRQSGIKVIRQAVNSYARNVSFR